MQLFSARIFIRVTRGSAFILILIPCRIQIHYIVSSSQTSFRLVVWNVKSVLLNSTIPLSKEEFSDVNLVPENNIIYTNYNVNSNVKLQCFSEQVMTMNE